MTGEVVEVADTLVSGDDVGDGTAYVAVIKASVFPDSRELRVEHAELDRDKP